jgi:hypothetical protein
VIKTHTKDALENSWRCFFKLLCVIGCRVICFFSLRGGEYSCALLCVLLNTFLRTDLYLCALFLLLFFCSRVRNALPTRSTGTCGTTSGGTTSACRTTLFRPFLSGRSHATEVPARDTTARRTGILHLLLLLRRAWGAAAVLALAAPHRRRGRPCRQQRPLTPWFCPTRRAAEMTSNN